jgi:hypothetical protein
MCWRSDVFRNIWAIGAESGRVSDDLQSHPISGQWSDISLEQHRLLSAALPPQGDRSDH